MAQIDFYVLPASGELARQQFACRLTEKAYCLNHTVHMLAADQNAVRVLDDLLWTFRDGSFVPHEISPPPGQEPGSPMTPVTIGEQPPTHRSPDLLINLGSTVAENANTFPRLAEVVTCDEISLAQSRERFAQYRDQGHELNTHKL